MISFTNTLINYIPKGWPRGPILGIEFMLIASLFKYYCFRQSIFKGSPLSTLMWTNLIGFSVPLPSILIWWHEKNLFKGWIVNVFRGCSSFINFYMYWHWSSKYLTFYQIIVGESLCEFFKAFWDFIFNSQDPNQLLINLVVNFYYILKFKTIWREYLKESLPSEESLQGKSLETRREERKTLLRGFWSFNALIWITLPRLLSVFADIFYSKFESNPQTSSFVTSGTIIFLSTFYYLYLKLTSGYSEEGFSIDIKSLFAAYLKSENRIGGNFLTTHGGLEYYLGFDKASWFFYYVARGFLMKDSRMQDIINGPQRFYLFDALIFFFKNLSSKLMDNFWSPVSLLSGFFESNWFQVLPITLIIILLSIEDRILHTFWYQGLKIIPRLKSVFNLVF